MQNFRRQTTKTGSRRAATRWWRRGSRAVLQAWVLGVLVSCNDTSQLEAAMEALKAREAKVVAREEAASEREREFQEREQRLAAATAAIERQRVELGELKRQLEADIAEVQRRQEALILREKRGPAPAVTAERVIVVDPESGDVLAEKNADRRDPVASTQKLLTALLVIEAGGLDEIVTIEKEDSDCAPVKAVMGAGEKYTRRELLTVLLVRSYNNVARSLARDNAGSVDAFVAKMNERAKELGMADSLFANPNGLPETEQYSTARDMAALASAADRLPELRAIVNMDSYEWKRSNGSVDKLTNTNRVLRSLEFCDGMKTGFTNASGYCLVASGEKDGRRRIVVVLNDTSRSVWRDAQVLLEWSLKG